jgi:hypothetical protein
VLVSEFAFKRSLTHYSEGHDPHILYTLSAVQVRVTTVLHGNQ